MEARRVLASVGLAVGLLAGGCLVPVGTDGPDGTDGMDGSPGEFHEVPLRVVEQEGRTLAFVPVTVAGEGPFMFALDTGASASVVDDDVAERARLARTGERWTVSGILGGGRVPVAKVDEWKVGEVPLDPGKVTVIDLDPPRGSGGIQGLLGSDVLSDFGSIVVDYEDGMLRLPRS